MSHATRALANAATSSHFVMSYGDTFIAKGRAHIKSKGLEESSADRVDRAKARSRSFVATCKLREALARIEIIQGDDSSWLHVVAGKVVARFATVGDAVAAL